MRKNIVLVSGGIDSAVVLGLVLSNNERVIALTFDYGQANRTEIECAKRLCAHYRVSQRIVTVDMSYAQGACAALGGHDITHTFVPARNLLFLAYGVSLAEAEGACAVWFGANKDDHAYYPDCRPPFVRAMTLAAELGTQHGGIEIVAPLARKTKKEVVELGRQLLVPVGWTATCAAPIEGEPCGECRGCKQRNEALAP